MLHLVSGLSFLKKVFWFHPCQLGHETHLFYRCTRIHTCTSPFPKHFRNLVDSWRCDESWGKACRCVLDFLPLCWSVLLHHFLFSSLSLCKNYCIPPDLEQNSFATKTRPSRISLFLSFFFKTLSTCHGIKKRTSVFQEILMSCVVNYHQSPLFPCYRC